MCKQNAICFGNSKKMFLCAAVAAELEMRLMDILLKAFCSFFDECMNRKIKSVFQSLTKILKSAIQDAAKMLTVLNSIAFTQWYLIQGQRTVIPSDLSRELRGASVDHCSPDRGAETHLGHKHVCTATMFPNRQTLMLPVNSDSGIWHFPADAVVWKSKYGVFKLCKDRRIKWLT